jgi:hypothetical protein
MPPLLDDVSVSIGKVAYRTAIPELPAHYEVTFDIESDFKGEGLTATNVFRWTVVVTGLGPDAPYSEIEGTARRLVPEMLRLLAEDLKRFVGPLPNEKPATG